MKYKNTFEILEKNSFFENVTRIKCKSSDNLLIEFDVHNMFFDILGSTFELELTTEYRPNLNSPLNELEGDYIMNGIVSNSDIISFGGLLMSVKNLKLKLNNDEQISCIIKHL